MSKASNTSGFDFSMDFSSFDPVEAGLSAPGFDFSSTFNPSEAGLSAPGFDFSGEFNPSETGLSTPHLDSLSQQNNGGISDKSVSVYSDGTDTIPYQELRGKPGGEPHVYVFVETNWDDYNPVLSPQIAEEFINEVGGTAGTVGSVLGAASIFAPIIPGGAVFTAPLQGTSVGLTGFWIGTELGQLYNEGVQALAGISVGAGLYDAMEAGHFGSIGYRGR